MTVIICPACKTRFETAAAIPPTGRKVRCSKCGNVWQAMAVTEGARPAAAAPPPPVPPRVEPRPAPQAPRPVPAASPAAASPAAAAPRAAPPAGLGNAPGRFPAAPNPPAAPAAPKPNSGAAPNGGRTAAPPAAAPASTPAPAAPPPKKRGAVFSTGEEMQPDTHGEDAGFASDADQDFASYQSGALVDPDAGMATNIPIAEGGKRKVAPGVAIGWGVLALLLILVVAFVAMAPKTVVSLLPGASRLYAMMGKPVNTLGITIENVDSAWNDQGPGRFLQVSGDVVNLTGEEVKAPTVVVSLFDEGGKELTQATADVLPLAPGARQSFSVQVPSAPDTVRNLEVSFAKAE